MPGYQRNLIIAQASGTSFSTSTTETSILPTSAKIFVPSNYFDHAFKRLRVRADGQISNIVTTPGTLTLKFKLGPTANIAVATSQAIQLNAVAKTTVPWMLDLIMTLRTIGAGTAAAFWSTGVFVSESVVGSALPSAGGAGSASWQSTTPAVGTGFDSTVDNLLDLTGTFSISNAGNALQLHNFAVDDLDFNP